MATLLSIAACSAPGAAPPEPEAVGDLPAGWPPRVGEPYPDLELIDADGDALRIGALEGKVLLIELVGMNCPGCNAFSGGNRPGVGGLRGLTPQPGLPSIEELVARFAPGVSRGDPRLEFQVVQLYDYSMEAPDLEDAREWRRHFGESVPHARITVPAHDLRGPDAYALIPGFQLVDRDQVLRWDSTGHAPRHNLWEQLLPALPKLLSER
jgi:hypothetical protein